MKKEIENVERKEAVDLGVPELPNINTRCSVIMSEPRHIKNLNCTFRGEMIKPLIFVPINNDVDDGNVFVDTRTPYDLCNELLNKYIRTSDKNKNAILANSIDNYTEQFLNQLITNFNIILNEGLIKEMSPYIRDYVFLNELSDFYERFKMNTARFISNNFYAMMTNQDNSIKKFNYDNIEKYTLGRNLYDVSAMLMSHFSNFLFDFINRNCMNRTIDIDKFGKTIIEEYILTNKEERKFFSNKFKTDTLENSYLSMVISFLLEVATEDLQKLIPIIEISYVTAFNNIICNLPLIDRKLIE